MIWSVVELPLKCVVINQPGYHCAVGQNAHTFLNGGSESFVCPSGRIDLCTVCVLCVTEHPMCRCWPGNTENDCLFAYIVPMCAHLDVFFRVPTTPQVALSSTNVCLTILPLFAMTERPWACVLFCVFPHVALVTVRGTHNRVQNTFHVH